MIRLVLKDLSAARWFLLAGLPLYAAQLASMTVAPQAFFLATVVFTGMLAFGSIAIDEVQGSMTLLCSLPVSRREYVLGRYATTIAGALIGLATSFVIGRAVALAFEGSRIEPVAPGPATYAVLLAVFVLAAAWYYPFLFRFGAGRGLTAFAATAVALTLALAGMGYLLMPGSGDAPTPEQIRAAEAWVSRWRWALGGTALGIAAIALAVSAGLSVRFFERRDL